MGKPPGGGQAREWVLLHTVRAPSSCSVTVFSGRRTGAGGGRGETRRASGHVSSPELIIPQARVATVRQKARGGLDMLDTEIVRQ